MILKLNEKKQLNEDDLELVKITKPSAEKLFNVGETVYLLPNKVKLGNQWILPFAINDSKGMTFDNFINNYAYYNCNKETGTTVAFYKAV